MDNIKYKLGVEGGEQEIKAIEIGEYQLGKNKKSKGNEENRLQFWALTSAIQQGRKRFFFPKKHSKNVEVMERKILCDCSTSYRIFNISIVKCFHFFLWPSKIIEKQTLVKVHSLVA